MDSKDSRRCSFFSLALLAPVISLTSFSICLGEGESALSSSSGCSALLVLRSPPKASQKPASSNLVRFLLARRSVFRLWSDGVLMFATSLVQQETTKFQQSYQD